MAVVKHKNNSRIIENTPMYIYSCAYTTHRPSHRFTIIPMAKRCIHKVAQTVNTHSFDVFLVAFWAETCAVSEHVCCQNKTVHEMHSQTPTTGGKQKRT